MSTIEKVHVIAESYHEARIWAADQNIDERYWVYVSSADKLRGLNDVKLGFSKKSLCSTNENFKEILRVADLLVTLKRAIWVGV